MAHASPHIARVARLVADAVERLVRAGLPAVTVYAFDELWGLGRHVRDQVSRALQREYVLIEDVWGFFVPPGRAGWPPHRGLTSLLDRGYPECLNAWVGLSDAPTNRSCMHFVPLDEDPHYPAQLDVTEPVSSGSTAAPIEAGMALVWNATTLHWGGPCAEAASGPRVSCTFSLCRAERWRLPPSLRCGASSPLR